MKKFSTIILSRVLYRTPCAQQMLCRVQRHSSLFNGASEMTTLSLCSIWLANSLRGAAAADAHNSYTNCKIKDSAKYFCIRVNL